MVFLILGAFGPVSYSPLSSVMKKVIRLFPLAWHLKVRVVLLVVSTGFPGSRLPKLRAAVVVLNLQLPLDRTTADTETVLVPPA